MTYCDHQRSCEDICNHRCLYLCAFVCARDITACISLYKPPAKVIENSEFSIKKILTDLKKINSRAKEDAVKFFGLIRTCVRDQLITFSTLRGGYSIFGHTEMFSFGGNLRSLSTAVVLNFRFPYLNIGKAYKPD